MKKHKGIQGRRVRNRAQDLKVYGLRAALVKGLNSVRSEELNLRLYRG